jgi:hypothetical protein
MTKAIDIHVHVQPLEMMKPEARALMRSRPQELEAVMELAADRGASWRCWTKKASSAPASSTTSRRW